MQIPQLVPAFKPVNDLINHTRTIVTTVYLSVYRLERCYGGPEEGGWWYDAWEWQQVAIPFEGEVDQEIEFGDTENGPLGDDYFVLDQEVDGERETVMARWAFTSLPRVSSASLQDLLRTLWAHLEAQYGAPKTTHRYSMAARNDDYMFVYELVPGAKHTTERPHYH